jgi:hypothetical protein
MRTVHETEALRPSDPVPKHHSSNPSNKFQRIKLVLSNEAKRPSESKGSTPASPSSLHPSAALHPPHAADADHSHNNITYIQDLASPGAPTMVQFPPDISFTPAELSLPADALFHSLRRTLQFATEEGEALRLEADALEKQRKAEWDAKEVLVENYMEFQIAKTKRDRIEQGLAEELEGLDAADCDVGPSRKLAIEAKEGKLPWWREEGWAKRLAEATDGGQEQLGRPEQGAVRAEGSVA